MSGEGAGGAAPGAPAGGAGGPAGARGPGGAPAGGGAGAGGANPAGSAGARPDQAQPQAEAPAAEGLFGGGGEPGAKDGRTDAGGGAARIARESRAAFSLHDASTYIGGEIGSVNFQFGDAGSFGRPQRLLAGPLPEDELRRLRDRFAEPPGYAALKAQLAADRLLVLSGQPGTGRMFTALSLLDDMARGAVSRLDPHTDLAALDGDGAVAESHGYALEPAAARLPAELHLDRLSRTLAGRDSYAVLLTVPDPGDARAAGRPGEAATGLSRYHRLHEPAAADAVLASHLTAELGEQADVLEATALELAGRPSVRAALGLDRLLPAEAARFAALVASCTTGALAEDRLVAECRGFPAAQIHQWFGGGADEALPALRDAAYRIALAVFGRGSFNTVAEAAELLAWELAVTAEPERVIGRPLLGDGLEARLASTRAVTEVRPQPLVSGEDIPVRTVRFGGEGLAPALLAYVWEHHHNMRGPVLRWLDSLCQDPRPDVWTRAAVASGELCRHDCVHTLSELLTPMAEAEQARRGLFVATALESVLGDPQVGAALRAVVTSWGESADANLRWTAAAVLARGTATTTVSEALGRLGRIGTWEEGRLRAVAAESVVHLAGFSSSREPLARIRGWLGDNRREHQDLGLVATLTLCDFLTDDVWNPAPELDGLGSWPLALALCAAHPERAREIAGLLWTALNTSRSYEPALEALSGWLRGCHGKPWEEQVTSFLPLLVFGPDDRQRLLSLLKELSDDPDAPLGQEQTHRLRQAIERAGT